MADDPSFPRPGDPRPPPKRGSVRAAETPYRSPAPLTPERAPVTRDRAPKAALVAVDVEVVTPASPTAARAAVPRLSRDELSALIAVGGVARPSTSSIWSVGYLALPVGPLAWLARSFLPGPIYLALVALCVAGAVLVAIRALRRIW